MFFILKYFLRNILSAMSFFYFLFLFVSFLICVVTWVFVFPLLKKCFVTLCNNKVYYYYNEAAG